MTRKAEQEVWQETYTGFACNRCGQWHPQSQIPSKCDNCGCPEFQIIRDEDHRDGTTNDNAGG